MTDTINDDGHIVFDEIITMRRCPKCNVYTPEKEENKRKYNNKWGEGIGYYCDECIKIIDKEPMKFIIRKFWL